MNRLIIGESGGTKSDWIIVQNGKVVHRFESFSYHPSNWNPAFVDQLRQQWVEVLKEDDEVVIYCAGCFSRDKAEQLEKLMDCTKAHVRVFSDLHAAGVAACGRKGEGLVGIMGTGSVVFHFKSGEISSIRGGKGHLIGDPGSAYNFGKIVLDRYYNGQLSELQAEVLTELGGLPDYLDKEKVAGLSKVLSSFANLFSEIHLENIHDFIREHALKTGDRISLVGSYAWHNQNLLAEVFGSHGIEVSEIIERPIVRLTELSV